MRAKMDRADRAKQFMPFAALKGYYEALLEKEKVYVEKHELSEDMKEELDRTLSHININDVVMVMFYNKGEYVKVIGKVLEINLINKEIRVGEKKIRLDDIYVMCRKSV